MDAEAAKIRIQAQIETLEKGLSWLKDGTLSPPEINVSGTNAQRAIELIGHYERSIAALKAMLAEWS
jgi:hypothetical protein